MPSYKAPVDDALFLLNDVFQLERYGNLPGFADAAPIGDSALATALQRLHRLPERPGPQEATRLMAAFAPHRSLATMHLWNSLQDAA